MLRLTCALTHASPWFAWMLLSACQAAPSQGLVDARRHADSGFPSDAAADAELAQGPGDAASMSDAQLPQAALDGGPDAGSLLGPFGVPGLALPPARGEAIDVPNDVFSYVSFPEAHCGNGSSTGIAVQPTANPEGLLLFLNGGGACWDGTTCGFAGPAAVHLHEDVSAETVLAEAAPIAVFARQLEVNPFRRWAYAYVPYCTGDFHAGSKVTTYTDGPAQVTVHHTGANNLDAYLARLAATFGELPRVVVMGGSAGGVGATLNFWRVQQAFSHSQVDALDDAGPTVETVPQRWSQMASAWGLSTPRGCTDCGSALSAWLPFYATRLSAPRRYGLMCFTQDAIASQYLGVSGPELAQRLTNLQQTAAANQKVFLLEGTEHGALLGPGFNLTTSDGVTPLAWLQAFVSGDASWDHAGP